MKGALFSSYGTIGARASCFPAPPALTGWEFKELTVTLQLILIVNLLNFGHQALCVLKTMKAQTYCN